MGLVHGHYEDKVFFLHHHPVTGQRLVQRQQQGVGWARERVGGASGGRALRPPHIEGVVGVAGVVEGILAGRVSGRVAQQGAWSQGGRLIVALQRHVASQTRLAVAVLSGRQVRQLAPVDAQRSQPHQCADGESDSSNVTVLLALYVDIRYEAPGQREEGEETRAGGEMDGDQVHTGDQSFTEQETTADQELLTGERRGSGDERRQESVTTGRAGRPEGISTYLMLHLSAI